MKPTRNALCVCACVCAYVRMCAVAWVHRCGLGMTELLNAMDTRPSSVESITEALDANGQATADEFSTGVAGNLAARGAAPSDALQMQSLSAGAGEEGKQHDCQETVLDGAELDRDEVENRTGTPPPSSADIASAGEAEGGAEHRQATSAPSDMANHPREKDRPVEHSTSAGAADDMRCELESGSTVPLGTSEDSPDSPARPKALPTIRHLRIQGDPALCLSDEAVALLTDLFSYYRMETLELPRTKADLSREAASAGADAEIKLVEAAKTWAAQTGVALLRR